MEKAGVNAPIRGRGPAIRTLGTVLAPLILLLAVLLVLPRPAAAQETVLILGNSYKVPKVYLDESGEPRGILVDIARYVDERLPGYELRFELYPWARAYRMAENGLGGIIGLSMTTPRLERFDYSDVIYRDDVIIVCRKGAEFPYRNMEDLRGKILGVGRGGSFGDDFDRAAASGLFRLEEDNGPVQRLKKILRGRIDCGLISPGRLALERTIAQDEELSRRADELAVLETPFKEDPNYLGFAKSMGQKPFLDLFNDVLQRGRESGEIQEIIARHH